MECIPGHAVLSSQKGGAWMLLENGESAKEKAFGRVAPSPRKTGPVSCRPRCCFQSVLTSGVGVIVSAALILA